MFKTALLSCFLVSLSSTYGMHLVVSSEKNESNTTKISVEEISSSEPSVITVQSAMHASVNQNGFMSKTSSVTSTSRSFRDLQELEKLCDEMKGMINHFDKGKVALKIDVKTSFDKAEVYRILNKYFGYIEDTKEVEQMNDNSPSIFGFAVNTKDCKEDQSKPCGIFATRINKQFPNSPRKEEIIYNKRPMYHETHYDGQKQKEKFVRNEIRWNIDNSDENTKLLGKLLSRVLNKFTEQPVYCKVTNNTFTICTNNDREVLSIIQDIKNHGGLKSIIPQEELQEACQQFDEIFSEDYTEKVTRNVKYNKRNPKRFKHFYNKPWSL